MILLLSMIEIAVEEDRIEHELELEHELTGRISPLAKLHRVDKS